MPHVLPDNSDPARSWNPLTTVWRIFYPLFNPRPDASPARMGAVAPIYDLPSPYGKIDHPDNKGAIPYFVHPNYYDKLVTEPKHQVIHADPPPGMVVRNFGAMDYGVRLPFYTATGPLFIAAHMHLRGTSK
jgi:hypothetical protein